MKLGNFKVFCDVVRCRSFSRGAEINGISQSAASQTVNYLERELETQLINRGKRPFLLTPEGEEYITPVGSSGRPGRVRRRVRE